MTGTLVQFSGVPGSMTIKGDKASGSANIANSWGSDVIIAPEKFRWSANNKGFVAIFLDELKYHLSSPTLEGLGTA